MSMNPDIAAHYRRVADHKKLMSLARAWVKKGRGPLSFVDSVNRMWPTGFDRLGRDRVLDAWYLAEGGF